MPLFIRPEKTLNQHVMDAQPKRIFHYAAFRYLFFARLFTVLGNGIAPIALAFAVLDIGGTPAQLGIVVAARSLFNVIFLMVGGVLADRYPRGRVLFLSSMLAALSQALIAWLILDGSATIVSLAVIGAFNGAAAGIALPASSAMVPQTVPATRLRAANAVIQLSIYAGTVIGASMGGVLTSTVGPGWGLAIDALGFAISAPLYLLIKTGAGQVISAQSSILHDLRDGWQAFSSRSWVWVIVAQFTIVNAAFSGVVMVIGPIVADASFGRAGWGMSVAAQSVGLIAGSFIALRWRPQRELFIGVMLVALSALPVLLLSQGASPGWLMAAFFMAGMGFGQFGVVWAHSLQTHIPPDKLARVYAWDALGSFVAIPLGEIAAGPLAMHFGTGKVLLASTAAVLIATLAATLTPAIRRLDNPHH